MCTACDDTVKYIKAEGECAKDVMTACHHTASLLQGKGMKRHVVSVTTIPTVSHDNWDMTVRAISNLLDRVRNVTQVVEFPLKGNLHLGSNTVSRHKIITRVLVLCCAFVPCVRTSKIQVMNV